jgi:50S ribosomal protein L16 3-hydroxylase
VDQYDVFLLQARGRRRWQISQADVSRAPLIEDTELRILREFEADQDWLLEPGDMLYLPPNLAHHGVAQDDACMTWSVGFRAPAWNELLTAWLDDRIALLPDSQRYRDPRLTPPRAAGEIDSRARQQVRSIIRQQFAGDEEIDRWFGRYITEPPAGQDSAVTPADWNRQTLQDALHSHAAIWRNEAQRFAWLEEQQGLYLYVNGEEFELDWNLRDLASLICSRRRLATTALQAWLGNAAAVALLLELLNRGALEFHARD